MKFFILTTLFVAAVQSLFVVAALVHQSFFIKESDWLLSVYIYISGAVLVALTVSFFVLLKKL